MKRVKCPECRSRMKRVFAGNLEIGEGGGSTQELIRTKENKITGALIRKFKKVVTGQCYQLSYECLDKDCNYNIISRGRSYADARTILNRG